MKDEGSAQIKMLDFIAQWIDRKHYPPTLAEIADGTGYQTKSNVKYHLDAMIEKGLIGRMPRTARGLWVTPLGELIHGQRAQDEPIPGD